MFEFLRLVVSMGRTSWPAVRTLFFLFFPIRCMWMTVNLIILFENWFLFVPNVCGKIEKTRKIVDSSRWTRERNGFSELVKSLNGLGSLKKYSYGTRSLLKCPCGSGSSEKTLNLLCHPNFLVLIAIFTQKRFHKLHLHNWKAFKSKTRRI